MSKTFLIIFGMMIVTYLPRLVPFYILDKLNISERFKKNLGYIPFAALGAMVIPGGFSAISGSVPISVGALVVAVIASLIKDNIFVSVGASVLFGYVCLMIIG